MYMMSAAWAALAIVLSGLGALYTWWAWRHRGAPGLVRGVGITLLPIAMWLTGTLRLFAVTADWLAGWATGLVLSPSVIAGTVLAVVSVALLGLSGRLAARSAPAVRGGAEPTLGAAAPATRTVPTRATTKRSGPTKAGPADDDLDDIEALLRRNGIS